MIELGGLEEQAEEFKKRNVRVLAISLDDLEHSQATQAKFPHLQVVSDADRKLSEAVQVVHGEVGPGGTLTDAPTTILVDRQGAVRWVFRADRYLQRLSPVELLTAIDEHLPKP